MEDQNDSSSAQDPNAAEPQSGEQGTDATRQPGVEKRINELTAKYYAAQEASSAQILALTNKMAEMMSRQEERSAPKEDVVAVPEGADPAQIAYFEHRLKQIETKYEMQLMRTESQMHGGAAAQAGLQLATQFGVKDTNVANQIAQRAADLAAGWRQKGLPFQPSDAADFAYMEYLKSGGARNTQQTFSAPKYGVTPGNNPVPNYAAAAPRQSLPRNFDSLSPAKQIEALDNMDDSPI